MGRIRKTYLVRVAAEGTNALKSVLRTSPTKRGDLFTSKVDDYYLKEWITLALNGRSASSAGAWSTAA